MTVLSILSDEPLAKPLFGVTGMTLVFPETKVLFKFREIVPNERNIIVAQKSFAPNRKALGNLEGFSGNKTLSYEVYEFCKNLR